MYYHVMMMFYLFLTQQVLVTRTFEQRVQIQVLTQSGWYASLFHAIPLGEFATGKKENIGYKI